MTLVHHLVMHHQTQIQVVLVLSSLCPFLISFSTFTFPGAPYRIFLLFLLRLPCYFFPCCHRKTADAHTQTMYDYNASVSSTITPSYNTTSTVLYLFPSALSPFQFIQAQSHLLKRRCFFRTFSSFAHILSIFPLQSHLHTGHNYIICISFSIVTSSTTPS